jgi:hypothetical protein
MTDSDSKTWRDIAEKASKEVDPDKLLDLAQQLEKALDADQRLRRKGPNAVGDRPSNQEAV